MFEFKLPDVGEGLTEADILEWQVAPGASVTINQTLVEIETAKSVVELPSPVAGVVSTIHAETGTTVPVGTVIISIEDQPVVHGREGGPATPTGEAEQAKPTVLVGTGPQPAAARTRRLGGRELKVGGGTSPAGTFAETRRGPARAKPPVRLLAKQLGVDLSDVVPSSGIVITRSDVELAANVSPPKVTGPNLNSAEVETRETRSPIKGVRKATATAMTRSAFTAPHVTEFLTIDISSTIELLQRLKNDRSWTGVRLTPLVLVARALLLVIRKHPEVNARWDEENHEIVQPHYVNLGLAAATPRGLLVPNVKDAHSLDLRGLATAVEELVTTARGGKTSPEQMSGGTITITNIGALGVDAGTPILNPGEAAILAFGNVRDMPWVVDGALAVRKVTQLALSFDHRLVDGELGSRVLADLGRILSDPGEALTY